MEWWVISYHHLSHEPLALIWKLMLTTNDLPRQCNFEIEIRRVLSAKLLKSLQSVEGFHRDLPALCKPNLTCLSISCITTCLQWLIMTGAAEFGQSTWGDPRCSVKHHTAAFHQVWSLWLQRSLSDRQHNVCHWHCSMGREKHRRGCYRGRVCSLPGQFPFEHCPSAG